MLLAHLLYQGKPTYVHACILENGNMRIEVFQGLHDTPVQREQNRILALECTVEAKTLLRMSQGLISNLLDQAQERITDFCDENNIEYGESGLDRACQNIDEAKRLVRYDGT